MDVAKVEDEVVGDISIEGYAKILTIQSYPKWGETLIEEEIDMVETRGVTEEGDVPSTLVADLETPVPRRKRRRSKEEVQASWSVKRRRTRSITTAEAT